MNFLGKIPILKEFEWFERFEWFEWFGPSPIELFNPGTNGRSVRISEAESFRKGACRLGAGGEAVEKTPFKRSGRTKDTSCEESNPMFVYLQIGTDFFVISFSTSVLFSKRRISARLVGFEK